MARKFFRLARTSESVCRARSESSYTDTQGPCLSRMGVRPGDCPKRTWYGELHVQQPTIARIEKRTDMYISTLRSHIEAMGSWI